MVLEILLLLVVLILLFWVLLPALLDALQYLVVAVVYMSVVIMAFGVTAFVLLALCFESDEPGIEELTEDAVLYLNTMSFWIWTRFT